MMLSEALNPKISEVNRLLIFNSGWMGYENYPLGSKNISNFNLLQNSGGTTLKVPIKNVIKRGQKWTKLSLRGDSHNLSWYEN